MIKLFIILFLFSNVLAESIEQIALESAKKNCPLLSFNGKICPFQIQSQKNTVNLIAGLGFDTNKQIIRLPIFKSENNIEYEEQKYEYREFDKITDFYDLIYNNKNAKAGMYSHKEGADELFKNFYASNMKGTLAQKIFTTHRVDSNNKLDEYFEKAILLLPEVYNFDTYDYIIKFWGDSYILNASYGGIFENQRALRECYNADINDLRKNIESLINTGTNDKSVKFLEYSLYSAQDIIGGNPELLNITERIKSIKSNPVFIYGTKYPIWLAMPEGKIRENMKNHVNNVYKGINDYINKSVQRVKDLFLEESKKEKYRVYWQTYAVPDFSVLEKRYGCYSPPGRSDCDYCHETLNEWPVRRWGYSRSCVQLENMETLQENAVGYKEDKLDYLFRFTKESNTIDENGYFQMSVENYRVKWGGEIGELIEKYESNKIRSGCIPKNNSERFIMPGHGWMYGKLLLYCIKCLPVINYISEYGNTQEYLQCQCPKTI